MFGAAADQIGLSTAGSERVRIDASGNVGVGTTAPAQRLDIQSGTNNAYDGVRVRSNNLTQTLQLGPYGMLAESSELRLATDSNNPVIFYTNGWNTERMRIDGTGNVGVGTTSPAAPLHIAAGLTTTGSQLFLETNEPTVVANDVVGDIDFRGLDSGARTGARIRALATATWTADTDNAGTALQFFTEDATNTTTLTSPRMTIDSAGNVGIGTTNPETSVHTRGTGPGFAWENTDDVTGSKFRLLATGTGWGAGGQKLVLLKGTEGSDFSRFTIYSGDYQDTTMVGIGTALPAGPLDVRGGTALSGDHGNSIFLYAQNGGAGGNTNGGNVILMPGTKVGSGTSGNVGVGTTGPEAKLDVADTGTTTSAIIVPRAGNFTGTVVNGMIRYNTASTLFEFYQNGAWVNYTTVSDGRLKTNVVPVSQGLDIVNQLNPVFFDWDQNNPKSQGFGTQHQVGFIAQEVEKVLPEVVNKGEDSYRSVEYGKIVSVVVAAVQELYNKVLGIEDDVDVLKAKDATKDREIASVKAENTQIKVENAQIKAQAEAEKAAKGKEIAELKNRLDQIEKALKSK